MNKIRRYMLLFLLSPAFCLSSYAEDTDLPELMGDLDSATELAAVLAMEHLSRGIEVGLSFGTTEALITTDSTSDTDAATMTSSLSVTPVIAIKGSLNKFKDSNFGYYYQVVVAPYKLGMQNLEDNSDIRLSNVDDLSEVDLGTSIKGVALAVTPVFVYDHRISRDSIFQYGLGVGLGFMTAKGNYYDTEEAAGSACNNSVSIAQVQQNCVKQSIDKSGVDISIGLIFAYHYKNYGFSLTFGGPTVSNVQFNDVKISLSYVIHM
jgi:hypothetical protein